MKKLIAMVALMLPISVSLADNPPPPMQPRVSIFSTTTDWAALTGLHLRQFVGDFSWNNSDVKQGLVLYYLDAFPCYGEADSVRVWLGPNNKSEGRLRLVCVHAPEKISFAWRNATRDADQAETKGILTCPVTGEYELKIDISKCVRGPEWKEYK